MSHTFFTSDQHWGHAKIINMCARPFDDVDAMDRYMIDAWNAVVRPEDTVWHLGDFAYRIKPNRLEWLFQRLNGTKHLIQGNHDLEQTLALPWASVSQLQVIRLEGVRVTLCHYALREWPHFYRSGLHFFGHSHSRMPASRRCIDVGVDNVGFTPMTLAELQAKMASLPDLTFKHGGAFEQALVEELEDEPVGPKI